jgi:hypothetical protein
VRRNELDTVLLIVRVNRGTLISMSNRVCTWILQYRLCRETRCMDVYSCVPVYALGGRLASCDSASCCPYGAHPAGQQAQPRLLKYDPSSFPLPLWIWPFFCSSLNSPAGSLTVIHVFTPLAFICHTCCDPHASKTLGAPRVHRMAMATTDCYLAFAIPDFFFFLIPVLGGSILQSHHGPRWSGPTALALSSHVLLLLCKFLLRKERLVWPSRVSLYFYSHIHLPGGCYDYNFTESGWGS